MDVKLSYFLLDCMEYFVFGPENPEWRTRGRINELNELIKRSAKVDWLIIKMWAIGELLCYIFTYVSTFIRGYIAVSFIIFSLGIYSEFRLNSYRDERKFLTNRRRAVSYHRST